MHLGIRGILVIVVAQAALESEGNITATGVQTAVELEHTPEILILDIRKARLTVAVDSEVATMHLVDSSIGDRVGNVKIRIGIVGSRK